MNVLDINFRVKLGHEAKFLVCKLSKLVIGRSVRIWLLVI